MFLGKVIGNVVSTIKDKNLNGAKLMTVKQVDVKNLAPYGKPMIAIDSVEAGIGDNVLLLKEGGSARLLLKKNKIPVNLVIVGVVDNVDLDNWQDLEK